MKHLRLIVGALFCLVVIFSGCDKKTRYQTQYVTVTTPQGDVLLTNLDIESTTTGEFTYLVKFPVLESITQLYLKVEQWSNTDLDNGFLKGTKSGSYWQFEISFSKKQSAVEFFIFDQDKQQLLISGSDYSRTDPQTSASSLWATVGSFFAPLGTNRAPQIISDRVTAMIAGDSIFRSAKVDGADELDVAVKIVDPNLTTDQKSKIESGQYKYALKVVGQSGYTISNGSEDGYALFTMDAHANMKTQSDPAGANTPVEIQILLVEPSSGAIINGAMTFSGSGINVETYYLKSGSTDTLAFFIDNKSNAAIPSGFSTNSITLFHPKMDGTLTLVKGISGQETANLTVLATYLNSTTSKCLYVNVSKLATYTQNKTLLSLSDTTVNKNVVKQAAIDSSATTASDGTLVATYDNRSSDTLTVSVTVDKILQSITVDESSKTVNAGETVTVTGSRLFTDSSTVASLSTLSASSSDTSKATVSINSSGILEITGVAETTSAITITVSGTGLNGVSVEATVSVTVTNLLYSSISLSSSTTTVFVGSTSNITGTRTKLDSTVISDLKTLSVASADSSKVTASIDSSSGELVLTGVAESTGTVTVTVSGSGASSTTVSATIAVTVKQVYLQSISLSQSTITIAESETQDITGSQTNNDSSTISSLTGLTAASADSGKVTASIVSGKLQLTGVAVSTGSVTVTVSGVGENSTTISQTIAVTVVSLDLDTITLTSPPSTLDEGSSTEISGIRTFTNSSTISDLKTLTASSSDTSKATASITTDGKLKVTGVADTTTPVTITVTGTGQGAGGVDVTKSFTLTINDVYLDTITLAQTTATVFTNNTLNITGTQNFSNSTTSDLTGLTASSADTAKVTATITNGELVLTGVAATSSAVTVTITGTGLGNAGADVTTTIDVTVTDVTLTSISLAKSSTTLNVGTDEEVTGSRTFSNSSTLNNLETLSASSADTSKVTASISSGKLVLTPVATTSSAVTVTVSDGGSITATISVTVKELSSITLDNSVTTNGVEVNQGGSTATVTGTQTFSDSSTLTNLTGLSVDVADTSVATAAIDSSGQLIVTSGSGYGYTTITVKGGSSGSITASFQVRVLDPSAGHYTHLVIKTSDASKTVCSFSTGTDESDGTYSYKMRVEVISGTTFSQVVDPAALFGSRNSLIKGKKSLVHIGNNFYEATIRVDGANGYSTQLVMAGDASASSDGSGWNYWHLFQADVSSYVTNDSNNENGIPIRRNTTSGNLESVYNAQP